MSKWNKKYWAEVVIIFGFLTVSVILLGAVAALLGEVIIRLLG